MQPREKVELLLDELRQFPPTRTYQDVLRQLRDFKEDESVFSLLITMLEDDDMDVRAVSIEALGSFKSFNPIPTLEKALEDEEWEVKWAALRALGTFWGIPNLKKMGDRLIDKRVAGIESIQRSPQFFNAFIAALDDEEEVQSAAIQALFELEDERAISHLERLSDEVSLERKAQIKEVLLSLQGMNYPFNDDDDRYLLACDECGQALPYSSLMRVANRFENTKYLCQFHFEEYQEKVEAFQGKLKQCKVSKIYWPKVDLVEGTSPPVREKRYYALPPVGEGEFRCFYHHKVRKMKDLSPVSKQGAPLCHKAAYTLAKQSANPPFLTKYAIQFLREAYDKGFLLCERTRIFHPFQEIEIGEDFRDKCYSYETTPKKRSRRR